MYGKKIDTQSLKGGVLTVDMVKNAGSIASTAPKKVSKETLEFHELINNYINKKTSKDRKIFALKSNTKLGKEIL